MAKNDFPHDAAYKALFSFPSMVESLLLDFLPEQFVQYFDFSTLRPLKASYIRKDLKQLHNDVAWKVKWRGKPSVLALILEFQSTDDYWMSARILAYTSNFWLDYINGNKLKTGGLLPAVFPIVLYNGARPWKAPTGIRSLIDLPYSQFMPAQPDQTYYVIDARRVPPEALAMAKGAAAYIIRGEQATTGNQLAEIGMEFVARPATPGDENLDDKVVRWLEMRLMRVEPDWQSCKEKEQSAMMLSELLKKMQSEIKKCREEARIAGLAEGKAEGLAMGKAEGMAMGRAAGLAEGKVAGLAEGKAEGLAEGKAEGLAEGLAAGEIRGAARGKAEVICCQRTGLLEMLALKYGEVPAEWRDAIAKIHNPDQISKLTIAVLTTNSRNEYEKLLAASRC